MAKPLKCSTLDMSPSSNVDHRTVYILTPTRRNEKLPSEVYCSLTASVQPPTMHY